MKTSATELATLAPDAYVERAVYERELARVLRPGWIAVARTDQLREPGDYVALELFGDPLIAVRGDDGELRVLSGVCRHRWMPLLEPGTGRRKSLVCPYHRWTYGLDGRLLGAPEMQRTPGFAREECRLPALRAEIWQGWLFASFDPQAAPLAPQLGGLARAIAPYRPERMRTLEPIALEHEWNWKIMVENFLESYHHQGTHAQTLQPLIPAAGTWAEDSEGPYAVLHNPVRGGGPLPALLPVTEGLSEAQRGEFVVGAVFPFHMFAVQPDALFWYRLEPLAVDRIRLWIHPCVAPEALENPRWAAGIAELRSLAELIHREDMAACSAVQRGARASLAAIGALAHGEKALAQFAAWWRAQMQS